MGCYMRFLLEDDRPLSLDVIMAGLSAVDPGFALSAGGDLTRGGELLAQLELNQPGDGLFEDGVGLLCEQAEDAGKPEVATRLGSVTAILAAQVLLQGRDTEETLDLLDPLWEWLIATRRGLLHADAEGFYDRGELILQTS
jgi:hypothetical protein